MRNVCRPLQLRNGHDGRCGACKAPSAYTMAGITSIRVSRAVSVMRLHMTCRVSAMVRVATARLCHFS